jgi:thioredoxin reductase (NADPH)
MVVGEGNFAANQALELLQYTPHVSICTQGKEPAMNEDFLSQLDQKGIVVLQDKIVSLSGDGGLEEITLQSGRRLDVQGLFIAMGEASSSDFAYSLGLVRNGHFIDTDRDQCTSVPGVFAAGDCVGRFLQIGVAVGEGALAGREAINYVKKMRADAS